MPVFHLLERMVIKKFNFPPGVAVRVVARSAYVGMILMFDTFKGRALMRRAMIKYC